MTWGETIAKADAYLAAKGVPDAHVAAEELDLKVALALHLQIQLIHLTREVTEDALCRGGYEIEMFKALFTQELVPNADYHLVLETLRNIGVNIAK